MALTPTAYAVLGMLSLAPMSGYELARNVARTIAHFWPISKSQVYSALARLEELGHVSSTAVAQERVPDKRTYRLTEAGASALDDWLRTPDYEPARPRSEFLLKTFFSGRAPEGTFAEMLDRFAEDAQQQRDHLAAIVSALDGPPEAFHPRATALLGLRQAEAVLGWVKEVRATIPSPRRRPLPRRAFEDGARALLSSASEPVRRRDR